jgi:hypothetical protein
MSRGRNRVSGQVRIMIAKVETVPDDRGGDEDGNCEDMNRSMGWGYVKRRRRRGDSADLVPLFSLLDQREHQVLAARSITTRSVHLNPLWPLSPKLTFVVVVASSKAYDHPAQPSSRPRGKDLKRFASSILRSRGRGVGFTAKSDLPNVVSRFPGSFVFLSRSLSVF